VAEAGGLVDRERRLKSRGEGFQILGVCVCVRMTNFGHAEQERVSG